MYVAAVVAQLSGGRPNHPDEEYRHDEHHDREAGKPLMATLTVDFFSSLDGNGSAHGWPGY